MESLFRQIALVGFICPGTVAYSRFMMAERVGLSAKLASDTCKTTVSRKALLPIGKLRYLNVYHARYPDIKDLICSK